MKFLFLVISSFILSCLSLAQVESSSSIHFTNTADSLRLITGLSYPQNDSSGLNLQTFISGEFYYGEMNTTQIQLDFNPDYLRLEAGMYFNLKFNSSNDSSLTLQIDQLPPVSILNYDLLPLDSGSISPGEIITVVFNGTVFIIMNPPKDKCPTGFVSVNERFCIETTDRVPLSYFNAVQSCGDNGFSLCGYSDWFEACLHANGVLNMTDNYEWVNTAGNSGTQIKVMGMDSAGTQGCDKTYTLNYTSLYAFRCCYYLKK